MTKHFALLFLLISLAVSLGLNSNSVTSENHSAINNPTLTPDSSAKIEKLEVDRNEVVIPCPPSDFRKEDSRFCGYGEKGIVTVKTFVSNPKNVLLTYQYTITGGRIIGQGEKVVWDLKNIRPGIYEITVAIDEGYGLSTETKTQEVNLRECDCPVICTCPTITVTGGGSVKVGEPLFFTANVSGGGLGDITYKWTISIGEITGGQGTSEIKVKTTDKMIGETVKATVEIGGFKNYCGCESTASETGSVAR